jgi:hypothetical protein
MPARKKSTAKKPKKDKAGISINIKNVMKQIQNERPRPRQRTDFIQPSRTNPNHNLNNGSMTRMFAPAVTYASAPLSSFPSLASLQPIQGGRAQPQLAARSDQPLGLPPVVAPKDIRNDDLMVPVLTATRATPSRPPVGGRAPSRPINLVQTEFNGVDTPESNPSLFAARPSLLDTFLVDTYTPRYNRNDLFRGPANDALNEQLEPAFPLTPPGYTPMRSRLFQKDAAMRAASSDE